jgi:hypothetical protein
MKHVCPTGPQVCLTRAGWRFHGAVHEYMAGPEGSRRGHIDLPSVSLYQVRAVGSGRRIIQRM